LRFSHLFLASATPEFFRDRSARDVADLVLGSFRHLQRARPERVDVEIEEPGGDTHPPTGGVAVIRTHVSERPFIVATVREYLHARDLAVERFLHPVLRVVRDAAGSVTDIGPAADGAPLESLIYAEVRRICSR